MNYLIIHRMYTEFMNVTTEMVQYALPVCIVFGPLLGFISQYNMIKTRKSIGSFSIYVCAILIFANVLRIFFW